MKNLVLAIAILATTTSFAQVFNPTSANSLTTNPSTGNVGVGTATPTERLEVMGNIKLNALGSLRINGSYFSPDQGGSILLKGTSATSTPYLNFNKFDDTAYARFIYRNGTGLALEGTKLNMDNLGIEFLHSTYGSGYGAKIYGVDEANGYTSMRFGVRANNAIFNDLMKIRTDGKIGIGVGNFPTNSLYNNYKLFVTGGILADEVRVTLSSSGTWADYVFASDYQLPTIGEVEAFIKENKHLPNVPSAAQVEAEGINVADMARIQQEKIEELMLYIIQQNKRIEALEAKMDNK
jgi:hypothetical protein